MLAILSIPHNNAECERIFSIVNKTRNKFRASMNDETLENVLIAKASFKGCCHEQVFDTSFLKKAKSTTYVNNSQ